MGDEVVAFRKWRINSRIGEWLNPFIVLEVDMDSKLVYVLLKKSEKPKASDFAQRQEISFFKGVC